ncbi:MAG: DEAD/DEAH box helicase, partial [Acidimicrobiales bacterium]
AERDPRFTANVDALRAVLPADLTPDDIDARLGAAWIPGSDVEAFAADVLSASGVIVDHAPATATWAVQAPTYERRTVVSTSAWGTARADAFSLLQASLNQQAVTVHDAMDDGSRVINPAETLAAREKQEALENRFASWVWEEPHRAQRLARRYNDLFNATVVPRYDGSHLSLPGLSCDFRPHDHQLDAVWRILQEPTVLLAHAVGAGKTAIL